MREKKIKQHEKEKIQLYDINPYSVVQSKVNTNKHRKSHIFFIMGVYTIHRFFAKNKLGQNI